MFQNSFGFRVRLNSWLKVYIGGYFCSETFFLPQVTILKGLTTICQNRYHPFELLCHLDNVRSVTLEEMNTKITPQKFEGESPFRGKDCLEKSKVWVHLRDLVLFFPRRKIAFEEFLFLFRSFPNLNRFAFLLPLILYRKKIICTFAPKSTQSIFNT